MALTRRRFLEDSLLATTAALTAGAVHVQAAEEGSKSPNEKLGVAVVGVRGRGGSHIGAFAGKRDTEILYIVDPDEAVGQSRADGVAKKQENAPKFVRDMRAAFDDPRVDIVSIATPNHWHALAAIWAIQAGKDVYVEKPVSHNVSEGRRIVEAARKYNKIVQTGTQSRSNPGTINAMKFIHEGGIGEVKVARGLCYKRRGSIGPRGNYDVPSSVDYNIWLGPAAEQPLTRKQFHYDWHWQWPFGNGDLGNQGIHQMDIARYGLGVDGLGDRVVSYGGRFGYEDAGDTANTQVSIHGYGDRRVVFEVRGLDTAPFKGAKVGNIFHGTDGYVVMTSYDSGVAYDNDGNVIKKFSGGADHFGNFISAVRSRKVSDLNADILEGHLSSALCHLGNISYQLGSPLTAGEVKSQLEGDDEALATFDRVTDHLTSNKVDLDDVKVGFGADLKFDSESETFPGNDAANAKLTREYRAPFVVPGEGKV